MAGAQRLRGWLRERGRPGVAILRMTACVFGA